MAELRPYCFTAQVVVWATSQEAAEEICPSVVASYGDFDWTYDDWTSNDPDWVDAMGGVVEV